MYLEEILKEKKKEIEILKNKNKIFLKEVNRKSRDFKKAISKGFNIIAEVKKASPSKGLILKRYRPIEIAKKYERYGASAISVLTCGKYFFGSIEDLKKVKENVSIPVLRKDFIIDEIQIYEAKYSGADAVLLIASILSKKKLKKLFKLTKELNLDALVEVHNKRDLDKTLDIGADIIGINNRNLKTLEVDFKNSIRLSRYIPEDRIKISESGIEDERQVSLLKKIGFNGILIGHRLLMSQDLKKVFENLKGGIK